MGKRTAALDSSTKRIGALILAIGLIVSAYGILTIAIHPFGSLDRWIEALTLDLGWQRNAAVPWGFFLSIIGAAWSFGYDFGIRYIVEWVRMDR